MTRALTDSYLQRMSTSTSNAIGGLGQAIRQKKQDKASAQERQEQQSLRTLQKKQVQQNMQRQEYDMKASVGAAVLSEKALKLEPPGDGAKAEDWQKYAKAQEAGGYKMAAKQAYAYSAALGAAGSELPDNFKSFPEAAKLNRLKRIAITEGRLEDAKNLGDRIKKINTISEKSSRPLLESSKASAGNIKATLAVGGAEIEGELAVSLGDLSRSLTERAKGKFNLTQSQVNDLIAQAYLQVEQELGDTTAWYNFTPDATKSMVEAQVIKNLSQAGAAEAGRGTETIGDTEELAQDDLLNKY